MTPHDDFVAERKPAWDELSMLLAQWGKKQTFDGPMISRIGALYRSLCNDIVHCKASRFGPDISAHLDTLAARTHSRLYNQRPLRLPNAFDFVFAEFPRSVRKNGRFFLLSTALFLVPFLLGLLLTLASKDFARSVIPAGQLEEFARSYKHGVADGKAPSFQTMMAGFYVINNVGIAFRCFATGIFFGLGSAFFLVYNGLFTGCIAGYVTASGAGPAIWTYMSGHSPFEITAIILSGAAGLEMGYSLVATDGRTRVGSLRAHARSVAAQIVGAALMLLVAATIEGYWSHSTVPDPVKWVFAAVGAIVVSAFLLLGGRGPRAARGAAS